MVDLLTATQKQAIKDLLAHAIDKEKEVGNRYHFLALDPGETTGWATFAENGKPTGMGQIPEGIRGMRRFFTGLATGSPFKDGVKSAVIIYEDFHARGVGARIDVHGARTKLVIKVIKEFGIRWGAEVVMQQPTAKRPAQTWSGLLPEGDHRFSHKIDGFNQGWFYLVKKQIVSPRVAWEDDLIKSRLPHQKEESA